MKTTPLLLTAAISALALASCASEDEPLNTYAETSDGISFRSAVKSRATETNNANLQSFYVTAFAAPDSSLYFENEEFTKGSDSFFTSPHSLKWLDNDETLKFFAYSPSQDDLGADITQIEGKAGLQLENFAVPDQIADQVDFITANASGNRKDNEATGVELTFDHRLSQIEVQAKSDNTDYTFEVTGVRIGRAEYMGTFDFTTNKWTLDDWHDTAVYTNECDATTLTSTAQSIMGPSGNAMLLPQTLTPWDATGDPDNVAREAYLSVKVRITRTSDGYCVYPYPDDTLMENGAKRQYAWAAIPLSGTWEQGKKYVYTLDFTDGAGNVDPDDPQPGTPVLGGNIKFKVTVNDWVEAPQNTPMTEQFKES